MIPEHDPVSPGSDRGAAERRRVEEALRESESHLRSLMDSARHYAVYRLAVDPAQPYLARVVLASPSTADLLGISDVHDLASWFSTIHPDDLPRCVEANRRSLETGAPFDVQFRVFKQAPGKWDWIHVRSTPVLDPAGRLTHFNGLIVDVTEQKRAEGILQAIVEFEDAIARISGSFINLPPEEVDDGIRCALQTIGGAYHVQHACVFQFSGDRTRMSCTHEWCAAGVEPRSHRLKDVPIDRFRWTVGQILRSEVVQVRKLSDMPPEARAERAEFEALGLQSRIVVPMVYRGAPVGFVGFGTSHARHWTDQSLRLQVIGDIIVNALEHRRAQLALHQALDTLEQRVEDRTRELSTLLEVSKNLVSRLELEPLLGSILDELRRVVEYEGCLVYTLEGNELVARAHRGRTPQDRAMGLRYGVDDPLDRLVLTGREPVLVSDTRGQSPEAHAYRESVGELQETLYPHIGSWLGVPLIAKGQVIGELSLDHSRPEFFTPAHASLAMAFANQAAVAIENARLYEAAQKRRAEAERRRQVAEGLREILAVLNSRQSLSDMLDLIATQACRVLGSDAAALLRLDKATGLLGIQAACQLDPEYASQISMPLGVGTAGRALAERRPVVISSTAEAAAYVGAGHTDRPELVPDLLVRLVNRYSALFSVPIVVKDEPHGALTFYYRAPHAFSEDEFRLALSVADQAALALENARLREQAGQAAALEERGRLARELHDSVTQSLYSVTMYAEAAARLMPAGQEEAAGYLRDARDTAQEALREMRLLIYQLRPPVLEKGGLAVALQVRLDAVERRGGIRAELVVEGRDRLPPDVQAELHHIAQEALNNALKHAHARQVRVRLSFGAAGTRLEVQDDGAGFDLAAARAGGGLGLPGMAERAQGIGGRLEIESAPGRGTRVVVEVPTGGEE